MSNISVEVLFRSERLSMAVDLKNDHSLNISVESWKLTEGGSIYVECKNGSRVYAKIYKNWSFKTDTTTQKFLAGYDAEALIVDLFDDYNFPHEEKRYIANAIICACEKLENGEVDNG